MKKLFLFLAAIAVLTFACNEPANAQDRTISKTMGINDTYFSYTGVAADTLGPVSQDTIDFVLQYRADEYVQKIAVKIRWDLVSGADTNILTALHGKEFSDHTTYTQIIAAARGTDINANNTIDVLVSDPYFTTAAFAAVADTSTSGNLDSLNYSLQTHTTFDKSYRYYRLRMIHTDASGAGSGVKIDEIEFKFYTD